MAGGGGAGGLSGQRQAAARNDNDRQRDEGGGQETPEHKSSLAAMVNRGLRRTVPVRGPTCAPRYVPITDCPECPDAPSGCIEGRYSG